jgi:predicted transcriptional regulator
MAREIVSNRGLNEQQTAELLGLSQSAVSRYVNKERGNNLLNLENSTEILALINQMVATLIKEPDNKTQVLELFCQTCQAVRKKGLMCPNCQKEMPPQWAKNCLFCR